MPEQDYLAELIKKVKAEKKQEEQQKKPAASLGEELEKSFRAGEDETAPGEETMEALEEIAGKETAAEEAGASAIAAEAKGSEAIGAVVAEREATEEAPEKSDVEKEIERAAQKKEITSYGDVKIYQIPGKPLLYYYVPVARPKKAEKTIISTIKEAATRLITISPYRIREPEQRKAVYKQKILEILRNSPELHIPERRFEFYAECVVREMVGYGIIDPLVTDDNLEEIMIIGPRKPVYLFHREYEMMTSNIEFYSDQEVIDLINRIARQVGRRVDISSPLLDARLPDGSRVNATIAPASVEGATLTIRKFRKDPYSMIDLISLGTISAEVAGFLWLCVEGMGAKPANILIAGGTSSGKTTTLNCLASFIPERERIITIEDTAELNLPLKHWIRLEARPPGLEGKGELTLDILTKNSLRMRPDRIIVGEVRHDEAFTLFTALNTGHDGCMGTVHANSPQETIVRVTNPPMSVPEVMLSGLDIIMVEHKIHDKRRGTIRRVTNISEVSGVLLRSPQTQTIFERNPITDVLEKTTAPIKYLKILQDFTGLSRNKIEEEWRERTIFLQQLSARGIRGIAETKKATELFLLEGR
jgi:flagellar protein FlaI